MTVSAGRYAGRAMLAPCLPMASNEYRRPWLASRVQRVRAVCRRKSTRFAGMRSRSFHPLIPVHLGMYMDEPMHYWNDLDRMLANLVDFLRHTARTR